MPHFVTWDSTYYDYHGGAHLLRGTRAVPAEDLVLNYTEIEWTY